MLNLNPEAQIIRNIEDLHQLLQVSDHLSLPLKPREPFMTGVPDRGDPGDGDVDDDGEWDGFEERSHDQKSL